MAWLGLGLLVVGAALPALGDPPFWDANVYVHQAQFAAAHGWHLAPWRHPPDIIKPPVFTTFLLGGVSALTGAQWALHLCVLGAALALPLAQRALVRALGGSERVALLAGLLCATAPLFVAQTELVQSDLPMAALATWAWVALVRGRYGAWLLLTTLAVLTKESAYFLSAPALAYFWFKRPPSPRHPLGLPMRELLMAAWPGVVLLLWLAALAAVTGNAIPKLNRDALRPNFVVDALIHQFVEGGRLPLLLLALFGLRRLPWSAAQRATAVGVLALPVLFFAPLPRYMLPGLPWVVSLAALTLDTWPARRRHLTAAALVGLQVIGWFGPSWHSNGGHHLDCNLRFRRLLAVQRQAVQAVAAERPARVVAAFPLFFSFVDPPAEGWLDSPLQTLLPDLPTTSLCKAEFYLDADQTAPTGGALRRLKGALTPWRSFGPSGLQIRVWRIACR